MDRRPRPRDNPPRDLKQDPLSLRQTHWDDPRVSQRFWPLPIKKAAPQRGHATVWDVVRLLHRALKRIRLL